MPRSGAILQPERRGDGSAAIAIGGEYEGPARGSARGDCAIELRIARPRDAVGGQQRRDQIGGAACAGVFESEIHHHGFPGIDDSIRGSAEFQKQSRVRAFDIRRRRRSGVVDHQSEILVNRICIAGHTIQLMLAATILTTKLPEAPGGRNTLSALLVESAHPPLVDHGPSKTLPL